MIVTAVYCNRCGCENPADRGACLMCLNVLHWPPGGNACPSCGADNAAHALFCSACGAAIGEAAPAALTVAAAVNLVLGGAAEGEEAADGGYVAAADEIEPASVPEIDFEAEEAPEPVAELAPEPPAEEPEPFEPVAPLAEEIEEPPAPPPPTPEAAEPGPDFEELAIELEPEEKPAEEAEEAPPPPPPPGAVTLDEEPAEEADFGGWTIELDEDQESEQ
jgi:outer membrane biosynthesis protein TonB